jgi:hypothetical protein
VRPHRYHAVAGFFVRFHEPCSAMKIAPR